LPCICGRCLIRIVGCRRDGRSRNEVRRASAHPASGITCILGSLSFPAARGKTSDARLLADRSAEQGACGDALAASACGACLALIELSQKLTFTIRAKKRPRGNAIALAARVTGRALVVGILVRANQSRTRRGRTRRGRTRRGRRGEVHEEGKREDSQSLDG